MTKKTTTTKSERPVKVAPPVPEGMLSLVMSKEDLQTFANLLSICAQTFEQLALKAANENDENAFTILQARHKLTSAFASKVVETCRMPEPISRDFH